MKIEFYFYVFKVIDDRFLIWNHESSNKTNPIAHTNAVWPFFSLDPNPSPHPTGHNSVGKRHSIFTSVLILCWGNLKFIATEECFERT